MATKLLALTVTSDDLVCFVLILVRRYDVIGVGPLVENIKFGGFIADKALNASQIVAPFNNARRRNCRLAKAEASRRSTIDF